MRNVVDLAHEGLNEAAESLRVQKSVNAGRVTLNRYTSLGDALRQSAELDPDAAAVEKLVSGLLTKEGARHSKADRQLLQRAHDALTSLGAQCNVTNEPDVRDTDGNVSKSGARHSKADLKLIQGAHDALSDLGAVCRPADDEGSAAGNLHNTLSPGNVRKDTHRSDLEQVIKRFEISRESCITGGNHEEAAKFQARIDRLRAQLEN